MAGLFFGITISLALSGFFSLHDSPYTGIRVAVCGHTACVKSVDAGSPADPQVQAGDLLVGVDGQPVSYLAFHPDPDFIRSRKDLRTFWAEREKLSEITAKDKTVSLLLEREGRRFSVNLTPARFSLYRALVRTAPLLLVGWTFMAVAWLVLRRKDNEIACLNFFMGSLVCLNFSVLAPFTFRDIFFPYDAFRMLFFVNTVTYLAFSYSLLHMMLIFPRRKKILLKAPWLLAAPHVLFGVMALVHIAGLFDNTHLTIYVATNASMLIFFGRLIYDYFNENSMVYKKQIQWVVFGIVGGISCWLGLTSIPIMFGAPLISEELSVLPTVIYPLCFAFAVTRYRLMDIDAIVDYSVVYGLTILLLAGVELTFLRFASPYFLAARGGLPYVSLSAVMLIVFIYAPVRNRVKGLVERLFRRGSYDADEAIQKFMITLGQCDNTSALEKFTSFTRGLLGPAGACIIEFRKGEEAVTYRQGDRARAVEEEALRSAAVLRKFFHAERPPAFGYELAGPAAPGGKEAPPDLDNCLFIPFYAGGALSHLAVLLPKWNGAAYRKKDRALLDTISASITRVLEAEEERREMERERLRLAREIHDGISSEFAGILSYGEQWEKAAQSGADANAMKDIYGKIIGSSRRGMQEIRNIIFALNPEKQTFDFLAAHVRRYTSDLLGSKGIEVSVSEERPQDGLVLSPGLFLTVFRTVQELCHNALKHSGAGSVRIRLSHEAGWIHLEFVDDGRGFEPGAASGNGNGLRNMARRAREAAGSFDVASTPGSGSTVRAKYPVRF
jgi:signal transduction histidine kinase